MKMISDLLKVRLDELEVSHKKLNIPKKAFFDMDNTILVGDIGELVVLALLNENMPLSMSWEEYLEMLKNEGERIAYRKINEAKAGNSVENIKLLVSKLLDLELPYKYLSYTKKIPKQNASIKNLLFELKIREYELYLITASSQYVAEAVVEKWFPEIENDKVFGVRNKVTNGLLSDELVVPFPIKEGKGQVIDLIIGNDKPLICAGDSINDVDMLNKTHQKGLNIIVDHKPDKTFSILKNLNTLDNIFFLEWN